MEEKRNKIHLVVTSVALAQLVAAVGVMIYGTLTHKLAGRQGDILVAASLFIFWALTDVAEPVFAKRFDGITQEQKSAYLKFAAFDFAGLAGIAYFLFSMNGSGNSGILGAVVYAVSIKLKRENQDIFYGNKPDDEQEEETAEPAENGDSEKELPEAGKEKE